MKKNISMLLLALCSAMPINSQNISGTWTGELDAGAQKLLVVFNINNGVCTMDSPDQGAKGIATTIRHLSADSICVDIPSVGGSYAGRMTDGIIKGTFSQMGYTFALNLKEGNIVRNRPQMPHEPYPYATEKIIFHNAADNATLSGTLTYPEGFDNMKAVPVVLMVTGSGLQNRDEEVFEHKPFLVIADYLARHGIASLRYDDRGFGKSTGDVTNATTEDFMRDARAGIDYLKATKKFGLVGVLGHSEGGQIAFMLGRQGHADFIVSMAGPGLKGDSIIVEQNNAIMKMNGMAGDMTVKTFRELIKTKKTNTWYEHFLDYDPAADIAGTKCPVMAINGSKDTQVLSSSNLATIKRLLPYNKADLLKEYVGLNHLFQHCESGATTEYADIEETISSQVLADIAAWINTLE